MLTKWDGENGAGGGGGGGGAGTKSRVGVHKPQLLKQRKFKPWSVCP